MFEQILSGVRVIVFDIDDTLLLWKHNKRWKNNTLAFIPEKNGMQLIRSRMYMKIQSLIL